MIRVLVPVTGAYHGRLRVKRSTGELDVEGLDRVLSEQSVRALSLAKQLQAQGAELVAVHVDKGRGEDVLREALAHGISQGILIEGAGSNSDASVRAATIADVYQQHGPFNVVVGTGKSEFGGFSGTLAAVAGLLGLSCAVGVKAVQIDGAKLQLQYESIFGDYDLQFPQPCVLLAGNIAPSYATAWGISDAYRERGILRVQADQYRIGVAMTERVRIEPVREESHTLEEVDGTTLLRRLRSRSLIPEAK
jgi:electron transfer flavoprotein alpha/beta subunit